MGTFRIKFDSSGAASSGSGSDGHITAEQQDCLYWLGRYSERVFTTTRVFMGTFDEMIDSREDVYKDFCRRLEIPNIYTSSQDFVKRYCYDETNPDSLISNLTRAFDNAILLREVLGSDVLSYIQLAVYNFQKSASSSAPILELQQVCDDIAAFWGMADDSIPIDRIRDLLKAGRRIERVDLYARLEFPESRMADAIRRLTSYRLVRSGIGCREERIRNLEALQHTPGSYRQILFEIDHLFDA